MKKLLISLTFLFLGTSLSFADVSQIPKVCNPVNVLPIDKEGSLIIICENGSFYKVICMNQTDTSCRIFKYLKQEK